MKAAARGCLLAAAILVPAGIIAVCWALLAFQRCEYRLIEEHVSPTGRYVAAFYGADCGMANPSTLLVMRNAASPALPNLDGQPSGAEIAWDLEPRGREMYWAGETRFVIQHARATPPQLERREWGGVRIETEPTP